MYSIEYSLVIPVLNEREYLSDFCTSILQIEPPPIEIHFIDGGSSDGSYDFLLEFGMKYSPHIATTVHLNPGGFPGGNRNIGIRNSKAHWIAFLDIGTVPNQNWIQELINSLQVSGANHSFSLCKFMGKSSFQVAVCALTYGYKSTKLTLPGGIFHSSLFSAEKIGVFNDSLRAAEDQLWVRSLLRTTPRNIAINSQILYSDFPKTVIDCLRKSWSYQVSQSKSGVAPLRIWAVPFFYFIFIPSLFLLSINIGLLSIFLYMILRGIIEPMRRSNNPLWYKGNLNSFVICLWLGPLIDLIKAISLVPVLLFGHKK